MVCLSTAIAEPVCDLCCILTIPAGDSPLLYCVCCGPSVAVVCHREVQEQGIHQPDVSWIAIPIPGGRHPLRAYSSGQQWSETTRPGGQSRMGCMTCKRAGLGSMWAGTEVRTKTESHFERETRGSPLRHCLCRVVFLPSCTFAELCSCWVMVPRLGQHFCQVALNKKTCPQWLGARGYITSGYIVI